MEAFCAPSWRYGEEQSVGRKEQHEGAGALLAQGEQFAMDAWWLGGVSKRNRYVLSNVSDIWYAQQNGCVVVLLHRPVSFHIPEMYLGGSSSPE